MTEADLQVIIDHFNAMDEQGDVQVMVHSPSQEFNMPEQGVIKIVWNKKGHLSE